MNIHNIKDIKSARAAVRAVRACELSEALELCKTLFRLADQATGMDDRAMAYLVNAQARLRRVIIETPAASCADVAAKFGLVAHMAENEDGLFHDERDALQAALDSLAFREGHFDVSAAA